MLLYLLKLAILLPVVAGLIWASLKFTQRLQARMGGSGAGRSVRIIESCMVSPGLRLAVIEFHGREILVAASRGGLTRLAEAPAREIKL